MVVKNKTLDQFSFPCYHSLIFRLMLLIRSLWSSSVSNYYYNHCFNCSIFILINLYVYMYFILVIDKTTDSLLWQSKSYMTLSNVQHSNTFTFALNCFVFLKFTMRTVIKRHMIYNLDKQKSSRLERLQRFLWSCLGHFWTANVFC